MRTHVRNCEPALAFATGSHGTLPPKRENEHGEGIPVRVPHILVVDDNRLIRSVIAMHFRDEGYVVSEASDGSEALRLIHTSSVDAVLMDLQMPGMDGISAARALRSDPSFEMLPVFAFTGYPQSLGADRKLFTEVLVKPMAPMDIQSAIGRSLPELEVSPERNQ